jgi:hypothetical protein
MTFAVIAAGQAHAQSGVLSADSFHGFAQVTASAGGTERSWVDGGFGKTDVPHGGVALDQAALEWRPRFNFAVSGVFSALYQSSLDHKLDVGEAYLKLKAPPSAAGKLAARVGVFYPPISLEHEGLGWTTPNGLSGSALNTWVGEELKVTGAEASLTREFGAHEVTATGALFGWADTAGTLLTFRGWALDEVRGGVRTDFQLPPLSVFAGGFQAPETYPFRELDRRGGYYLRLEWRPPAPVSLHALWFDNGGDRTSVDSELQWAWKTTFAEAGVAWQADETTRVLAQAMRGTTVMGYPMPTERWFDAGFWAAYVAIQRTVGDDVLSGRLDGFGVDDRSFVALDNNDEAGWAATAAWRHRLGRHADLIVEAKHIDSRRPSRSLAGEAPRQGESLLQTALRLSF